MFPIKMKMNCSIGSPVATPLWSLTLRHTDRPLSNKGCSDPTHHPPWTLCVHQSCEAARGGGGGSDGTEPIRAI